VVSSDINKRKYKEVKEAVNNLLSTDKPSLPPPTVPIERASGTITIPSQRHEVYWLSSEAHEMFHPKEHETVLDAMKKTNQNTTRCALISPFNCFSH
jgi:hypothetical protein